MNHLDESLRQRPTQQGLNKESTVTKLEDSSSTVIQYSKQPTPISKLTTVSRPRQSPS